MGRCAANALRRLITLSMDLSPAPKKFLPTMTNCSELVTDWMDYHSMAVLQCFNNRLQFLDLSGEAQKMMAEYMKDKDSWSGMLMAMAMKAWTAVVAWFM